MIKIDFKPSEQMLRQFGWVGLFAFPGVATLVTYQFLDWQWNWIGYTLIGLGAFSGVMAATAPRALKPVFISMMLLALPIGFVVSAVLLRLLYYGLFTPMALWFKLIGRDSMRRTLDPDVTSYWEEHRDLRTSRLPASYFRMY